MIKKLTNHILSYLISSNAIDDNEETKDYYRYGIEITISSLINILLIIIIGIVSGNALESMANMACGCISQKSLKSSISRRNDFEYFYHL